MTVICRALSAWFAFTVLAPYGPAIYDQQPTTAWSHR